MAAAAETDAGRADRLGFLIAALIVLASLAGAGVAFSVSSASSTAGDLDQRAQQEFLQKRQLLAGRESQVGEELRLVGVYQDVVLTRRLLERQAERVRSSDPELAKALEQEAQGLVALARLTGTGFRAAFPSVAEDGTATYDRRQALANLLSQDLNYQELHPEAVAREAEEAHDETVRLVGVGVVFALALFFLTLAQLARGVRRIPLAGVGALAVLAGGVLWALVEGGTL